MKLLAEKWRTPVGKSRGATARKSEILSGQRPMKKQVITFLIKV